MAARKRILLLEDDQGIREALKLYLEMEGYEVHLASHGQEGLSVLAQMAPPDLMVIDLMMPVMDGWTFAKELEKRPEMAKIPILVVTAGAERAGTIPRAKAVIRKPMNMVAFAQLVRECTSAN